MMEEAVTDTIIKGAGQRIDAGHLPEGQENEVFQSNAVGDSFGASSGVVNIEKFVKVNKPATGVSGSGRASAATLD